MISIPSSEDHYIHTNSKLVVASSNSYFAKCFSDLGVLFPGLGTCMGQYQLYPARHVANHKNMKNVTCRWGVGVCVWRRGWGVGGGITEFDQL